MSTEIASLVAVIGADYSGLEKGLSESKGMLENFSQGLSSAGAMLTAGLTLPLIGLGTAAVKSFSDSETALTQLDAVLKSTSSNNGKFAEGLNASIKKTDKWSEQLEKAKDHLAELEAKSASSTKHTQSQTDSIAKAQAKVDELTARVAKGTTVTKSLINVQHLARQSYIDLAAQLQKTTRFSDETILSSENMLLTFTNIGKQVFPDATRAVLDMSTALGQDTKSSAIQLGKALNDPIAGVTALQRVGVAFTKSQKNLIEKMVQSGDIMGAQKLILAELKTEFGGSAEAAGNTFAGSIDKLKNKFDDFLEVVGAKLAPALSVVIDFFSRLIDGLATLDPWVVTAGVAIGGLVAAAGPLLSVLGAITSVIAFLGAPLTLIIAGIAALGVAFATNFGGIRDLVLPVLTRIVNGVKEFASQLGDFIDNVKKFGLKEALLSALNLGDGKKYVTGWIQGVLEALGVGKDQAAAIVIELTNQINNLFPQIEAGFNEFKTGVIDPLVLALSTIWETVSPSLGNLLEWFVTSGLPEIAHNIAQLMTEGIIPMVAQLANLWKDVSTSLMQFSTWFRVNIRPIITDIQTLVARINDAINAFNQLSTITSGGGGSGGHGNTSGGGGFGVKDIWNGFKAASGLSVFDLFGHRASGGPVAPGGTYVVGERGPEILRMGSAGGSITPNGSGYNGPSTLTVALQADGFEEHIVVNLAQAIAAARLK